MKLIALVNYFLIVGINYCIAQSKDPPTTLYYLSVGSTHYDSSTDMANIPYANNSAKEFSEAIKGFNSSGILLLSSEENLVSKKRILNAFSQLQAEIEKNDSTYNVILLYFCGHGFNDMNTGLQFFLPGNFYGDFFDKHSGKLVRDSCVTFLDFVNYSLKKINRLIILFDCCYSEISKNSLFSYYEDEIERRKSWPDSIKKTSTYYIIDQKDTREKMKSYEKNWMPTVSASKKDSHSVVGVNHPFYKTEQKIGPLCRRIILASNRQVKGEVSLLNFFQLVVSKDLDLDTQVGDYSNFDFIHNYFMIVKK